MLLSPKTKRSGAIILIALSFIALPADSQTTTKILGSNGTTVADVVPANTAPGASNKALVVTISPNSPSPGGSQDVNLIKVGGTAIAIGQAAMAASLPVAIASNQSALSVVSSTLATEATLSTLSGKFGTLGQKTMAGSAPVVIASDQSAVPISGTVTVTPSGTQNVNLTQVGSSAVALGQTTMASSIPTVIASNQSAIPVSQSGSWTVQQGTPPWTVTGTGAAGAAASGVVSVQGIASMTPVQVSQATATNLNAAVVGTASDNSANSTAKLPVISARANAAAPTWTEGNQAPLSVDLGGLLRTYMGSWLGSTAPTVGQKTSANSLPVVVASDQSAIQVVGNVAAGAAVSGNPVQIAGSDGTNVVRVATDSSGRIKIAPFTARYLSGNGATTTVLSGAGVLHSVVVADAAASATWTIYDNTAGSGTIIFSYAANADLKIGSFLLDVTVSTGITVVTTGTPSSSGTVTYRATS